MNVFCNLVTPLVDILFYIIVVFNFMFLISANKRFHSFIHSLMFAAYTLSESTLATRYGQINREINVHKIHSRLSYIVYYRRLGWGYRLRLYGTS